MLKPGFIIDDMDEDGINETEEVGSDEEEELFDSVCAICDNGGDLLWYALFISYSCIYSFDWMFFLVWLGLLFLLLLLLLWLLIHYHMC